MHRGPSNAFLSRAEGRTLRLEPGRPPHPAQGAPDADRYDLDSIGGASPLQAHRRDIHHRRPPPRRGRHPSHRLQLGPHPPSDEARPRLPDDPHRERHRLLAEIRPQLPQARRGAPLPRLPPLRRRHLARGADLQHLLARPNGLLYWALGILPVAWLLGMETILRSPPPSSRRGRSGRRPISATRTTRTSRWRRLVFPFCYRKRSAGALFVAHLGSRSGSAPGRGLVLPAAGDRAPLVVFRRFDPLPLMVLPTSSSASSSTRSASCSLSPSAARFEGYSRRWGASFSSLCSTR